MAFLKKVFSHLSPRKKPKKIAVLGSSEIGIGVQEEPESKFTLASTARRRDQYNWHQAPRTAGGPFDTK